MHLGVYVCNGHFSAVGFPLFLHWAFSYIGRFPSAVDLWYPGLCYLYWAFVFLHRFSADTLGVFVLLHVSINCSFNGYCAISSFSGYG